MDQLKDVILSTLEEIQESIPHEESQPNKSIETTRTEPIDTKQHKPRTGSKENFFNEVTKQHHNGDESELLFLNSLRERMLVLFEGFQAPNNTALEAKIDLTLNFLEYVLASIDTRLEQIKGK